jgi:hypothetical protein
MGEVFIGRLEPGVHYVDAVFNFGGGRVGRSPLTIKIRPRETATFTVFIDRNDEEFPAARVERAPAKR